MSIWTFPALFVKCPCLFNLSVVRNSTWTVHWLYGALIIPKKHLACKDLKPMPSSNFRTATDMTLLTIAPFTGSTAYDGAQIVELVWVALALASVAVAVWFAYWSGSSQLATQQLSRGRKIDSPIIGWRDNWSGQPPKTSQQDLWYR